MGQYLNVLWDLDEIMGEVKMLFPAVFGLFKSYPEAVNDIASLALRDRSNGTEYYLDEFIRDNLGSEFQYLGLWFKANSAHWYREIVNSVAQYVAEYDEFFIEDIRQYSPTKLLIVAWVEYHYEGDGILEEAV